MIHTPNRRFLALTHVYQGMRRVPVSRDLDNPTHNQAFTMMTWSIIYKGWVALLSFVRRLAIVALLFLFSNILKYASECLLQVTQPLHSNFPGCIPLSTGHRATLHPAKTHTVVLLA